MLFGLEGHVASQAQPALVITACAFLMVGITRCISAYFYAVEKTNVSSLLVYIEPCLFFPIALYTLPLFFELNGVWLGPRCFVHRSLYSRRASGKPFGKCRSRKF